MSPTASEQLRIDLQGLPLDEFYVESYDALLQRTPELIVWRGLTGAFPPDSIGLNNVSDAYQRETFAMHQVVLEMLRTYDRSVLAADEQLTYDIYEWQQQDEINRLEFIYYDFVATYNFYGIHRDLLDFFTAVHPLDAAIFYMGEIADVAANTTPYYTVFVDKVNNIAGLNATDRQSLVDATLLAVANSVIPAYRQLRQTMQGLLASAPPSSMSWAIRRLKRWRNSLRGSRPTVASFRRLLHRSLI